MLYPAIEPFSQFRLPVSDGHELAAEISGNPDGKPVVLIHGGPGSGRSATARRYFNPELYRIIAFDQRGCGESRPHAADDTVCPGTNTTAHLISDLEALRAHLEIDRWMIYGASWGSTLGLLYAQSFPARVTEMILAAVTTTSQRELEWLVQGVGAFFPDAFEKFAAPVDYDGTWLSLTEGYAELLADDNPATRAKAAQDWCTFEQAITGIDPDTPKNPKWDDPRFMLAFARLVTHYWNNKAWLSDGQILRNTRRISHIPAALVHGRLDFSCPAETAWRLHKAWPASTLTLVSTGGHDRNDRGMGAPIVAAADRFSA